MPLHDERDLRSLVEHRLRFIKGRWCIAAKRVNLINSEAELPGIAFLLQAVRPGKSAS